MKKKNLLLGLALLGAVSAFAQQENKVLSVENLYSYDGDAAFVYNKVDGNVYVLNNIGEYERYGLIEKVTTTNLRAVVAGVALDELKAPDGAYIDLGYIPKKNTRVEAEFKIQEFHGYGDWKALYGTRFEANRQNDTDFPGFTEDGQGQGNGWKPGFAFFPSNAAVNLKEEIHPDEAQNQNWEILKGLENQKIRSVQDASTGEFIVYNEANEEQFTIDAGALEYDMLTPLYVLAINKHLPVIEGYNDNPEQFGGNNDYCYNSWVTLYSLKVYEGEDLIIDLVPYKLNGKSGLKNNLSGRFFASANDKYFNDDTPVEGITAYPGKVVYNYNDGNYYKFEYADGQYTAKELTFTYETELEGDYKDLNNWKTNDGHTDIFDGNWQEVKDGENVIGYKIDPYKGTNGHEPLMIQIDTEVGKEYNLTFTATWGEYNSWHGVEMHAYIANFYDLGTTESGLSVGGDILATEAFSFNGGNNVHYLLNFTAEQEQQTIVFQFGDANDGQNFSFEFDNLSVKPVATRPNLGYEKLNVEGNQGDNNQGDNNQGDNNQGDNNQGNNNQGNDNQGSGSETPTAVNAVSAGAAQAVKVYTLGGVYVGTFENAESVVVPSKGIYIVNDGVNVKKVRF